MPPARRTAAQQRAEAAAEDSVTFQYRGHSYTVPRTVKLSVFDALSTVDDDGNQKMPDVKKATQGIVGIAQWKAWLGRNPDASMGDLNDFFAAATGAIQAGK